MGGCWITEPHSPHSWQDGPGDEREWCDGSGDPYEPGEADEIAARQDAEDRLFESGAYDDALLDAFEEIIAREDDA